MTLVTGNPGCPATSFRAVGRPLAWMRQDLESIDQRDEPVRINLVQWWIVSQLHVFMFYFGLKSR